MNHYPPAHSDVEQAEKGKDRFRENRRRDREHHVQEGQWQQVGYDVDEDDVEPAASGDPGGLDVGLDADAQSLGLQYYGRAAKAAQDSQNQRQEKQVQLEQG